MASIPIKPKSAFMQNLDAARPQQNPKAVEKQIRMAERRRFTESLRTRAKKSKFMQNVDTAGPKASPAEGIKSQQQRDLVARVARSHQIVREGTSRDRPHRAVEAAQHGRNRLTETTSPGVRTVLRTQVRAGDRGIPLTYGDAASEVASSVVRGSSARQGHTPTAAAGPMERSRGTDRSSPITKGALREQLGVRRQNRRTRIPGNRLPLIGALSLGIEAYRRSQR